MHSNPEFTHHYRKELTPSQRAIEDNIVEEAKKRLHGFIDEEVRAANSRARMLIFVIIAVTIIIILLAAWWSVAHAGTINMEAIAQIESSGNTFAYNYRTEARGLYQITPICLKDYKQAHKIWYIDPQMLFKPDFNTEVALWYFNVRIPKYLKYYKKPVTTENIIWAYNAGIGNVVKGIMPVETKNYIEKYARLTKGR